METWSKTSGPIPGGLILPHAPFWPMPLRRAGLRLVGVLETVQVERIALLHPALVALHAAPEKTARRMFFSALRVSSGSKADIVTQPKTKVR